MYQNAADCPTISCKHVLQVLSDNHISLIMTNQDLTTYKFAVLLQLRDKGRNLFFGGMIRLRKKNV